jgi:hypothetical protein
MSIVAWVFISGFVSFIVGYWLGYGVACRQAAMAMEMLRMESEMYIGVLSRKEVD